MGTFRTTHLMMPELDRGTPMPHFMWYNPGNYPYDARTAPCPFQPAESNPGIGFTALLQSAGPIDEAPDDVNIGSGLFTFTNKKQKITNMGSGGLLQSSGPSGEDADDVYMGSGLFPIPNKKEKTTKKAADTSIVKTTPHKKSKKNYSNPQPTAKPRRSLELVINDTVIDIYELPPPVCTCTGVPRQCYRWGAGRWQSSCCTTDISQYPLPMSLSRRGQRMSGRKMSHGAYVKLLQRLSSEGYDLSHPIDLKPHWARRGSNKFVAIR